VIASFEINSDKSLCFNIYSYLKIFNSD